MEPIITIPTAIFIVSIILIGTATAQEFHKMEDRADSEKVNG